MSNPFIKDGFLCSNVSINKLVIEKVPENIVNEDIKGKTALDLFSTQLIIDEIKKNSNKLGLNLQDIEERQLPLYLENCLESKNEKIRESAINIIRTFGKRLGVILLTLKKGEKENREKRLDWQDEHWDYWSEIENVILVGGLANKKFGNIMRQCIDEVFKLEKEGYNIILVENPAESAIKGLAKYIIKKDKNKFNLALDFGQSFIKRSVIKLGKGGIDKVYTLEKVKSKHVKWEFDNELEEKEEAKLENEYIINCLIDTIEQCKENKYDLNNEIVISVANYIEHGKFKNRGGYGKLRLISDNYEEYLEKVLYEKLGEKYKITMVHDGTAMAAAFSQYSKAVCISLGTAFGVGFPINPRDELPNKIIMNNITSNEDNYNPSEITCFNRPWAIMYKSINDDYFDLYLFEAVFYEMFMVNNYFSWDLFVENMDENFYKFSKEVLEKKFGVVVDRVNYCIDNEEDFHTNIERALSDGYMVLVPSDQIELPYYIEYKLVPHIHFFIIKGYDRKRGIYYIMDNGHVDNGANPTFKDFMLTYDVMYNVANKCFENFIKDKEDGYFWTIKKDESALKEYSIRQALVDHSKLLKDINSGKISIDFPEVQLLNKEYDNLKSLTRGYAKVLNYKYVYYDVLFKLLKKINIDKVELNNLIEEKNSIVDSWEEIRLKMLYFLSKRESMRFTLKEAIDNNVQKEYKFRVHIISVIDKICISNSNDKDKNTNSISIKNRNKAQMLKDNDKMTVIHSNEKVYDTWLSNENATQIELNINKNDNVEFECKVKTDSKIGFAFFSGIILKAEDGEKYLFGNESRQIVSVHCPERSSEHLLAKEYYQAENLYLKVNILGNKVNFYMKAEEDDDWNKLYSEEKEHIKKVGLISKTWENVNHKTIFSNINVKVNERKINILNF